MAKLTEQKKLFVQEYLKLKCRNQTQAAINAGYSAKTAAAQASGLMKQDEVKGYLEEQKSALEGQIRETFLFDALEARKVMYEILVDPEAENRDRLNAAKDFLDRAGFRSVDRVEHSGAAVVRIVDDIRAGGAGGG